MRVVAFRDDNSSAKRKELWREGLGKRVVGESKLADGLLAVSPRSGRVWTIPY